MAISPWKSWPIQKITPLLYQKLFEFEGKKWSYFSHFHTLTWSNKHLKFHFRGYFTKSSFWHLKGEARAKIFTVLIAWLGLINFTIMCHLGTSKGFWAVRVSWSEADHHRSRRLFDIWLWQFYEKVIEKLLKVCPKNIFALGLSISVFIFLVGRFLWKSEYWRPSCSSGIKAKTHVV